MYPPGQYAGIAVLRLPPRPAQQDLLDVVDSLAQALARHELNGRLWIGDQLRIGTACQALLMNGRDVVAVAPEPSRCPLAEVLVELQPHEASAASSM